MCVTHISPTHLDIMVDVAIWIFPTIFLGGTFVLFIILLYRGLVHRPSHDLEMDIFDAID